MLKPGELDLSIAAEFDEGFPHAYFKMLRADAPVCWHPERGGPGHWAITRYDDLKYASRNPQVFSSALGGTTCRRSNSSARARSCSTWIRPSTRNIGGWCSAASRRA